MSFKLEGMDELIRKLESLADKAETIEKDAVLAGAEPIKAEIEKNAPRSSSTKSHAADHIVVEYDTTNKQAFIGGDKEKGWYLRFPEWGTSKQPAQAFTEKSFHNSKNQAQKEMAQVIKKELGL